MIMGGRVIAFYKQKRHPADGKTGKSFGKTFSLDETASFGFTWSFFTSREISQLPL